MTCEELIARMTSTELSSWQAFYTVRAEEQEVARLQASTSDRQVTITGRDEDDEDE